MSSQAYFSPNGGCEAAIVTGISSAANAVLGLLFMYQSEDIHNALIASVGLGNYVSLIFDRRQQFLAAPRIEELLAAGVECWYDKHEPSIRSQYLIVDPAFTFTGSYIYTAQSELRYAENLIRFDDYDLYTAFANDWLFHQFHSELIT